MPGGMASKSDLARVLADVDETTVDDKFQQVISMVRSKRMGSAPLKKIGLELFGNVFPTDEAVEKSERVEFLVRNLVVFAMKNAKTERPGKEAKAGTVQPPRSALAGGDTTNDGN